jgi:hypothetical protein
MSEQTPEVTVVTTLPATEESTPVEKKFFDTKKKAILVGAAAAALIATVVVKVRTSSGPRARSPTPRPARTTPPPARQFRIHSPHKGCGFLLFHILRTSHVQEDCYLQGLQ